VQAVVAVVHGACLVAGAPAAGEAAARIESTIPQKLAQAEVERMARSPNRR